MGTQRVSIRYLIDVAIGNPEPGIVNFNALYTVLQAISEKLALQDDHIEIDSSFCPVNANVFDSKSNVSSERLMDHQVFDYPSEMVVEKVYPTKKQSAKDLPDIDFKKPSRITINEQDVPDDRKVVFTTREDDGVSMTSSKKVKDDKLGNYRSELKQHIDALNARLGKIENRFASNADADQGMECIRYTLHEMQDKVNSMEKTLEHLKEVRYKQEEDLSACRKRLERDKLAVLIDDLRYELNEVKEAIGSGKHQTQASLNADPTHDVNFEPIHDYKSDHSKLQTQLIELKSQMCSLTERLAHLQQNLSQDTRRSESTITINTFQTEVGGLKASLEKALSELNTVQTEHAGQKSLIQDLENKVDQLTRRKVDKEEIDELLSEKADYTMLQRKVSVENMTADRRKTEKQLFEITECFVLNDERVQRQITDIKKFLGDQSIEEVLFDFKLKVDKEIQVVRDAIKRVAEAKSDVDSSVGRLKDLHCLSCDQDVVMKAIEMNNVAKFGDAYVSKSINPLITFEIGKLREAGKIGPMEVDENLCELARNFRHTGGMHTIITPKDRVLRTRKK